jgi:hypothetical protein
MIWLRPHGAADMSPLACPDFNGKTIAELERIRRENDRGELVNQLERLRDLLAKTSDEQTRAELETKIAEIEASLSEQQ